MTKFIGTRPAAQGDVLIVPVDAIPANVKPAKAEGGVYVIAHSETGHNHVIDHPRAEVYEAADNQFIAYIRSLGDGAEIVHKRDFHTHETIKLEPNKTYRVHRQREHTPEGFRRAID